MMASPSEWNFRFSYIQLLIIRCRMLLVTCTTMSGGLRNKNEVRIQMFTHTNTQRLPLQTMSTVLRVNRTLWCLHCLLLNVEELQPRLPRVPGSVCAEALAMFLSKVHLPLPFSFPLTFHFLPHFCF